MMIAGASIRATYMSSSASFELAAIAIGRTLWGGLSGLSSVGGVFGALTTSVPGGAIMDGFSVADAWRGLDLSSGSSGLETGGELLNAILGLYFGVTNESYAFAYQSLTGLYALGKIVRSPSLSAGVGLTFHGLDMLAAASGWLPKDAQEIAVMLKGLKDVYTLVSSPTVQTLAGRGATMLAARGTATPATIAVALNTALPATLPPNVKVGVVVMNP
jgi:hypothetical protein